MDQIAAELFACWLSVCTLSSHFNVANMPIDMSSNKPLQGASALKFFSYLVITTRFDVANFVDKSYFILTDWWIEMPVLMLIVVSDRHPYSV